MPDRRITLSGRDFEEDTEREVRVACRVCDRVVKILPGGDAERHAALCGRPCLAAGIPAGNIFHCSQCLLCYPAKQAGSET